MVEELTAASLTIESEASKCVNSSCYGSGTW